MSTIASARLLNFARVFASVVSIALCLRLLPPVIATNFGLIAFGRFVQQTHAPIQDAHAARVWFDAAQLQGEPPRFAVEQGLLASLSEDAPPVIVNPASRLDQERQVVTLWADLKIAVDLADKAESVGQVQQAKALRLTGAAAAITLSRLSPETTARNWDWRNMYRTIALCLKVNRGDIAELWLARIRASYPDAGHAYLYSLDDPYAQTALADAYASLGMLVDAVQVGNQALLKHDWEWGHYLIAGYYSRLQQPAEAENHLRAAITLAKSSSMQNRYRLALGDLYQQEGRYRLAAEQICLVIITPLGGGATDYVDQARLQLRSLPVGESCGGVGQ